MTILSEATMCVGPKIICVLAVVQLYLNLEHKAVGPSRSVTKSRRSLYLFWNVEKEVGDFYVSG